MNLVLICREDNDLYQVLQDNNIDCSRYTTTREAMDTAQKGAGIMILADGYPKTTTAIDSALFKAAERKNLRLYVEFPATLPDVTVGEPRGIEWERAVVSSKAFGPQLENLWILMIHGCRFVPVKTERPHIVMARVSGFDTAVYGLPEESFSILFEHPRGDLLVATTKLSQFVTARYAPVDAWREIWEWILNWVCPDEGIPKLQWAPTVRPAHLANEALPIGAEQQAFQRGVQWFRNARLFIHSSWKDEARRRLDELPDGTGLGPAKDRPVGDGSCGMIEGASSTVHPDGSQDWRHQLRNDCMAEASMAMAFGGAVTGNECEKTIAVNLNDFIYFHSNLAQGSRANPDSPSYGLVCWTTKDTKGGIYYGDDNARSMLGTMAASALLHIDRWDEPVLRCLLANLRTTGPLGFRNGRLADDDLQEKGWRHYWTTPRTNYAPHYESSLWACFLWAYHHTGFAPFIEKARTAIRMTMDAYPDEWRWANGIQQERARMLLPLAWLVRVEDNEQHRNWLRFMAEELLSRQDACGAIREEVGRDGKGSYGPPKTNEEYGTSEASLIQQNGDPLCDLLYTTNFAFFALHEASVATGDPLYAQAEEKLAKFLCRIQVRAETHPELDGAWFRAFEFNRWDYWASNADLGWGAWSIESGWTQAWISTTLALRQMRTSFWDLTAQSQIAEYLDKLAPLMLPDVNGATIEESN